jgi:hypothetical protein
LSIFEQYNSTTFWGQLSYKHAGQDSVVIKKTSYGPDGPGIKSWWVRDLLRPSRKALGPTQPPVQWVAGLFQEVKPAGRGVHHPPTSNAKVKERVELYSPSGPSWPVLG